MDLNNPRRNDTAYIKTLNLELNGNQINLSERPKSKDLVASKGKVARSLKPCSLRRPMSASPPFKYRGRGRLPSWSRPQSAEGSPGLRRAKLAANFSESTLHDRDYCPEFGRTYTMSSSQLLTSLMGSCSINEGLDSDSTPAPSPQPSLGDTIRAAAQLEPGLASKPPLPPSPSPQARNESLTTDDIINLKFQRWFPDAVLGSELKEVVSKTSLIINPFEKEKEESDQLDDGGSGISSAPLSARNENENLTSGINIKSYLSQTKTNNGSTSSKKDYCECNDIDNNCDGQNIDVKSPQIIIHEPNLYGCDIVTEEFASDTKVRCLTPEYIASLKKSTQFWKGKNDKPLSLPDLSNHPPPDIGLRSQSVNVYSENMIVKDNNRIPKPSCSEMLLKQSSDNNLKKNEEQNLRTSSNPSDHLLPRNDLESPLSFENSASKYRHMLTSTPIEIGNLKSTYIETEKDQEVSLKSTYVFEERKHLKSEHNFENKQMKYDEITDRTSRSHQDFKERCSDEGSEKFRSKTPPSITANKEEEGIYREQLKTFRSLLEDHSSTNNHEEEKRDILSSTKNVNENNTKLKQEEKHAHFSNCIQALEYTSEKSLGTEKSENKDSDTTRSKSVKTFSCSSDSQISDIHSTSKIYQILSKHRSEDNCSKNVSRKNNKPIKEISRAASVPPFPNNKSGITPSKQIQLKNEDAYTNNSKKKVRRSHSYDATVRPVLTDKDSGVSSYEDIVTMIKVLEKEDLESPVIKYKTSVAVDNLVPEQSSSAKAILNFLDEVEKGTMAIVDSETSLPIPSTSDKHSGPSSSVTEAPVSSRLGTLLNTDTAELAQQVMTLTLQLEEQMAVCKGLEERYKQSVDLLKQQKEENDEANKRQQKFIDQLLKEKRQLAVQYETAIKELEAKHEMAIKTLEERHKVEMKKAQEKFTAAEKIRRDKWIDAKTKKIKELTVRGLEPELERMAVAHQEEIAELRRIHQRELTEAEAAWRRRMMAMREQEHNEREEALQTEREAARQRMAQEVKEMEYSFQEQRRRLFEELRKEKESLQQQHMRLMAEKEDEILKQVANEKKQLLERIDELNKHHKEELMKMKECFDAEKSEWMSRQRALLDEKEAALKETYKRARDKHIEQVIRQLEAESHGREMSLLNKMRRQKESYEAEINDLESNLKDLKARYKEAQSELQKSEGKITALKSQLSLAENELLPLKTQLEKLRNENIEAVQQSESKIAELQKELNESKESFKEQLNKVHNEKEKQLQQVYTRVKETISKKEEALLVVTKQRDAALEQCNQLEKLLENQRNQTHKL